MAKSRRKKRPEKLSPLKRAEWAKVGRWMLALALFSLMGSGVVLGVMKLGDPNVLPLKVVRIDGDFRHLKRADLKNAVSNVMVGNFFTMDLDAVRKAALKLPWVEQVTIRRIWPDQLSMQVDEQVPLARWGSNRLVNRRGVVFSPDADEIPPGLPMLAGPEGSSIEVVNKFGQINRRMAALDLDVQQLRLTPRHSWVMSFDKGFELRLGNTEFEPRLKRFFGVYPQLEKVTTKSVKRVDLRYTNGVAILWQEKELQESEKMTIPETDKRQGRPHREGRGRV